MRTVNGKPLNIFFAGKVSPGKFLNLFFEIIWMSIRLSACFMCTDMHCQPAKSENVSA